MKLVNFNQFTNALTVKLAKHPNVLGLVALGSMANKAYPPDQWSDHDFFVIVTPGTQPHFKADLSWLPHSEQIVLAFEETAHGMKVLYEFEHLLEFAIFEPNEVPQTRINQYAMLIDKGDFSALFAELARETAVSAAYNSPTDHSLYGQFLANLFVGVGRCARGEQLSGRTFVKTYALGHLLKLLVRHYPSTRQSLLDNLDPYRRFERVYPEMGQHLNQALNSPTPQAAFKLISLSEIWLFPKIENFPNKAANILKTYIESTFAEA